MRSDPDNKAASESSTSAKGPARWPAVAGSLFAGAAAYLRSAAGRRREAQAVETERRRLFELSPDLQCIAGFDGRFRELSPVWESTLGFTRAELLGRPFLSFVHPEDVQATTQRMEQLRSGASVIDFKNRYACRDGAWRWLEWRAIPVIERELIYAVARDVTHQRQVEQELADVRRFAERVAEVMPGLLYVFDFERQRVAYVNERATGLLGLSPDHFGGSDADKVRALMHPDEAAEFDVHLKGLLTSADGAVAERTFRLQDAHGAWRWFHSYETVFERSADGRVRQALGVATDITAIKDAESALRQSNERMDFVLSAAKVGVWEVDLVGGVGKWSDLVVQMLGLPAEAAPTTLDEFLELVHPEQRESERRRLEEAIRAGRLYSAELRQNLPEGELRWIACTGKVLNDERGRPLRFVGLAWDITQRKLDEQQRARREEQVRQSQKMEALGTLAGGIAHDFNNILTAVTGNARLLLQELPPDHPARVGVQEIHRGATRAGELVRRILAFSRDEQPMLRALDLRQIVDEALALLRATTPAMIDIEFDRPDSLAAVMGDAIQMQQVIMNLAANARDAIGEGAGKVRIELRSISAESRPPEAAQEMTGDCVRLTFSDTGAGMSSDIKERIFEPFFTTKAPGHGAGMGLAIVHGIVRRHGGAIRVASDPGRGARFELFFPALERRAEPRAPAAPHAQPGAGQRILYVDDEEPLVFLATRSLRKMGYDAAGITEPQRALQEFEQDPARWDMVITDLGMPGMSGLDFARALLSIRPDLPIIITSGFARVQDSARAKELGIGDIVLKPNTVDEMAQLISDRLQAASRSGEKTAPEAPTIA